MRTGGSANPRMSFWQGGRRWVDVSTSVFNNSGSGLNCIIVLVLRINPVWARPSTWWVKTGRKPSDRAFLVPEHRTWPAEWTHPNCHRYKLSVIDPLTTSPFMNYQLVSIVCNVVNFGCFFCAVIRGRLSVVSGPCVEHDSPKRATRSPCRWLFLSPIYITFKETGIWKFLRVLVRDWHKRQDK